MNRLTIAKTAVLTTKPENPMSNRPLKVPVNPLTDAVNPSLNISWGNGVKRKTKRMPLVIPQIAPVWEPLLKKSTSKARGNS